MAQMGQSLVEHLHSTGAQQGTGESALSLVYDSVHGARKCGIPAL